MTIEPLYDDYVPRASARRAVLLIGIGGSGRVAKDWTYELLVSILGPDVNVGLVDIDLCQQTGRDGGCPGAVPREPGRLIVHFVEPLNCRALVERHGTDREFPIWEAVDPETIKHVEDTAVLGGYACPPVARTALEFNPVAVDDLSKRVGALADALRPESAREKDIVWIVPFASGAGAVGSTALCWLERILQDVTPPYRVLFNSLLIADRGAVPDRPVSLALQHAHLTEIRCRATRAHVRRSR